MEHLIGHVLRRAKCTHHNLMLLAKDSAGIGIQHAHGWNSGMALHSLVLVPFSLVCWRSDFGTATRINQPAALASLDPLLCETPGLFNFDRFVYIRKAWREILIVCDQFSAQQPARASRRWRLQLWRFRCCVEYSFGSHNNMN